ncbi:MAG: GPW/gp25 family protein [Pseudomonadota bacterium]
MQANRQRPFLGQGWKFPLQVNRQGGIAVASEEQRIEESVYLILSTAPGERVMQPEFGCGIHELTFENNTPAMLALVVDRVRRALTRFEPRIDLMHIDADSPRGQPNLVLIRVDYQIRISNTSGNLVYPFYIAEGN